MRCKKFIIRLVLDFLIALFCIGIFLLFYYVIPRRNTEAGTVILNAQEIVTDRFNLPQEEESNIESSVHKSSVETGNKSNKQKRQQQGRAGNGNSNTKEITADKEAEQLEQVEKDEEALYHYRDDMMQVSVKSTKLGEDDAVITYYTADVYISDIEQLRTAFAEGSYGKNIREPTLDMAKENQAVLAISGDSYGNSEAGVVVRNGRLYRSTVSDAEICTLFYDGTMEIYTPEEFDRQEILEKDVWQIWNFGPSLLDNGEVKETFQTTSYLNGENPRCGIGYVSPGHYKFVVADGRSTGYSRGATMSEFAQIMKAEGCILAYNLDGGKSSAMVFQNNYVNQPAGGGRDISDIIYIGKVETDE